MELILLCLVIVPYEGSFVFLVITYLEDVLGFKIDDLEFCGLILFFFHPFYLSLRLIVDDVSAGLDDNSTAVT